MPTKDCSCTGQPSRPSILGWVFTNIGLGWLALSILGDLRWHSAVSWAGLTLLLLLLLLLLVYLCWHSHAIWAWLPLLLLLWLLVDLCWTCVVPVLAQWRSLRRHPFCRPGERQRQVSKRLAPQRLQRAWQTSAGTAAQNALPSLLPERAAGYALTAPRQTPRTARRTA